MKKNKALSFIFITVLIDVIGIGIIIPIIPDLLKELNVTDLSEASVIGSWLMFSYAIMQFIFAPIVGGISDKIGRRPVLLIALFGLSVDYILHAIAPTIALLFVGRILAGMCGASFSVASAYIADVSSPEKKAQNLGLVGAAFGLGFIIGPALGGIFGEFGTRVPFYIAAGLAFVNMLFGIFILPESLTQENRRPFDISRANPFGGLKKLGRYPSLTGMFIVFFMMYFSGQAIHTIWTFFTMMKFGWDQAMVGYSLSFVGLVVAIVQGGLIRIAIPKFGERKTIIIGTVMSLIGTSLFAFASQGWMMFVILIPYALGGLAGAAMQGYISNRVGKNEQGELQGVQTSIMSLASIIGPPIMSGIFFTFTEEHSPVQFPGAPFLLSAIVTVGSLFLLIRLFRKHEDVKPAEAFTDEMEEKTLLEPEAV